MRKERKTLPLLLFATVLLTVSCNRQRQPPPPSVEAAKADVSAAPTVLETAWRFALAITNDLKDQAKCQEWIAMAWLEKGEIPRALKLAESIADWRRGVVWAEAAAKLAERGQTNEAMQYAIAAANMAQEIQDWQRDRIMVLACKTPGLLGQRDEVGQWSAFYQSNRDYRGEIAAYHALALARNGALTNALAVLDQLGDDSFIDVSSWRVQGYLMLAREAHFDSATTDRILTEAWSATEAVPGAKRWDVQLALVDTATKLGRTDQAREWLFVVTSNVVVNPTEDHAPWFVGVIRRWAALKDREQVRLLTEQVEPLITRNEAIWQPGLLAQLGEAWALLGDRPAALTWFRKAIEIAEGLVNLRPRAMAGVEICLSLDRAGVEDETIRDSLKRLLKTFGEVHG